MVLFAMAANTKLRLKYLTESTDFGILCQSIYSNLIFQYC
jgi:hypothetical protein